MDKIVDYIKVINVLNKTQCQNILNVLKNYSWEKHKWYNYTNNNENSEKEKELDITYSEKSLEDEMSNVILNALTKYQNYFIKEDKNLGYFLNKSTPIRWNRYSAGTMMRKHFDHIQSIFDGKHKGVPIVSIVGVLNDDYEGGEFVFNDNYEVKLNTGDILMFPSNFIYAHEVKEITKGTRYSFVSWAF
jgi:predicted 2-oxoglutarate/Fe(II)-dependent dioxygenase YbiX